MAKDYRGRQFERTVWEDRGSTVYVTSEKVIARLEQGDYELWPIGVAADDVEPVPQSL